MKESRNKNNRYFLVQIRSVSFKKEDFPVKEKKFEKFFFPKMRFDQSESSWMESLFGRGKALERGVGGPEKFPVRLGVKVEELVAYNIIIIFLRNTILDKWKNILILTGSWL